MITQTTLNVAALTSVASIPANSVSNFHHDFIIEQREKYFDIKNNHKLTIEVAGRESQLTLPIEQIVIDLYYKYLSEHIYRDAYKFTDQIFVFNAKTAHKAKYKNHPNWLKNLRQIKNFRYLGGNEGSYYSYKEERNIDWVDGFSDEESTLRNILNLKIPADTPEAFSKHRKEIILQNNFLHNKEMKIYGGYWKEGTFVEPNLIYQINYGKMKQTTDVKPWKLVFGNKPNSNDSTPTTCSDVSQFSSQFVSYKAPASAGFDAECSLESLSNSKVLFAGQDIKYTSGFASLKHHTGYYKTDNIYYSLLGGTHTERKDIDVSDENKKSMWYVDYDDVFVPQINRVDYLTKTAIFSIGINKQKIKNIDDFLTISSGLKFNFNFTLNNETRNIPFTFDNLVNNKKFSLSFANLNNSLVIENTSVDVVKDNEFVTLFGDMRDFQYKVDISKMQTSQDVFKKILFSPINLESALYSELSYKQKIYQHFFMELHNKPDKKYSLDKVFWDQLNIRFVGGSDASSTATMTYFDFLQHKDVVVNLTNLYVLPELAHINSDIVLNKNKPEDLKKHFYSDNQYFLSNISVPIKDKNIFTGNSKYSIVAKIEDSEVAKVWNTFYKDKLLNFFDESEIMIKLKGNHHSFNDLSEKFYITSSGRKAGLNLHQFTFQEIKNNSLSLDKKVLVALTDHAWSGSHSYDLTYKTDKFVKSSEDSFHSISKTGESIDGSFKDNVVLKFFKNYPIAVSVGTVGTGSSFLLGSAIKSIFRRKIL